VVDRSVGLPLEPIWQAANPSVDTQQRGGALPPELAARYAGELTIPLRSGRPTVIANFVSSLDGVVALGPTEPTAGGGEISGFSESDRFMMALLRGLADVVIVGAGTVRAGSRHEWTSRRVQPEMAGAFAAWRAQMGLAPQPTTVVVTARGDLDPTHAGFNAPDVPVIVATTKAGAGRLAALSLPRNVSVAIAGDGDRVGPERLLDIVRHAGARVALCEGGPHLFGQLLGAGLVDELFLTLAPQIIGRDEAVRRLALVEGSSAAGRGRWSRLVSVRRAGDDLFLRYRFEE
jgi:riboflavin biosynthesis pyrimidine reductase